MGKRHRHEPADTQWERIEHLLPGQKHDPGRTALDNRLFVNAVVFVLKTGKPLGRPARPLRKARHGA